MLRRLAFCVLLVACDRKETPPATVDAAPPPPITSVIPSAVAPAYTGAPISPVEALRRKVTRVEDDPALVAAVDALKKHYGGQVPKELWLQATERPEGRGRALIVADATKAGPGDPFAIAVDTSGAVQFTKDHPAAGIMAPIGPLAIA